MSQSDFTYGAIPVPGGQSVAVSIFADRPQLRAVLREDAAAAGFHLRNVGDLGDLMAEDTLVLGDLVLLDCPEVSEATVIALVRLDERVARSGAQLIVSTTPDGLADVFGCLENSRPQILVNPSRAERVVAMGRALAHVPARRVRELSAEDRLYLVRLAEQVESIAQRLDRAFDARGGDEGKLRSPGSGYRAPGQEYVVPGAAARSPALPEAPRIRRIIKARQARMRFFDGELFADPAWDILLDLAAARAEGTRISVTSLCIAAAVPATTALRWIRQMCDAGLLERIQDPNDRRRAFIALSDRTAEAMARYFAEVNAEALAVV